MSQVTIYVPENEVRAIRQAARQARQSVSEWARERMTPQLKPTWPPDWFSLFGALKDETFQRPVQPESLTDARRETI